MSKLLMELINKHARIINMYHIPFSNKLYQEQHYIYIEYRKLVDELIDIIKKQEEKLEKIKLIQTNYLPKDVEMVLMTKKDFDRYTKPDLQKFINT